MTQDFIKKAIIKHNNKYNYSNVNYVTSRLKVEIICKEHGSWLQRPNDHLSGYGCPACGKLIASATARKKAQKVKNEFVDRATHIHKNAYEYSKSEYIDSFSNIIINCKLHGEFIQVAATHLSGAGCYKCGRISSGKKRILTVEDLMSKFNKVHGNKYDYSSVEYVRTTEKIKIICKKHGLWEQTPGNHLNGFGCPRCVGRVSQMERDWLDDMKVPNTPNNRQVTLYINKKRIVVDGFISETNTIYEFYGDFWHGNPKKYSANEYNKVSKLTFGQLYLNTQTRKHLIQQAGYNIIEKWQTD